MRKMLPILAILFLGFAGYSMTLPLFPPLFLEEGYSFLSQDLSVFWRNTLLGFLLAMYPLGQFFGCPLIGRFSDRYGRKKILLLSLLLIIPTYVASALAIKYEWVIVLFVARFLCGLFEGDVVIAQAAMADLATDQKQKSRYFSLGVAASSLAFVIGPLIGGKLADPDLVSWFTMATPFWFAAGVFVVTFFYIRWQFEETAISSNEAEIGLKKIFLSIYNGTFEANVKKIYGMNILLFIGVLFFLNFLPVFLVKRFDMDASILSEVVAYLSVPIAIAPFFVGRLSKSLTPERATLLSALVLAVGAFIVIFPTSPYALIGTLIAPGIAIAWSFTFTAVMVSEKVAREKQGEALGINQSLQVATEAGTALVGGFLVGNTGARPIIASVIFSLIASFTLFRYIRKSR